MQAASPDRCRLSNDPAESLVGWQADLCRYTQTKVSPQSAYQSPGQSHGPSQRIPGTQSCSGPFYHPNGIERGFRKSHSVQVFRTESLLCRFLFQMEFSPARGPVNQTI